MRVRMNDYSDYDRYALNYQELNSVRDFFSAWADEDEHPFNRLYDDYLGEHSPEYLERNGLKLCPEGIPAKVIKAEILKLQEKYAGTMTEPEKARMAEVLIIVEKVVKQEELDYQYKVLVTYLYDNGIGYEQAQRLLTRAMNKHSENWD